MLLGDAVTVTVAERDFDGVAAKEGERDGEVAEFVLLRVADTEVDRDGVIADLVLLLVVVAVFDRDDENERELVIGAFGLTHGVHRGSVRPM